MFLILLKKFQTNAIIRIDKLNFDEIVIIICFDLFFHEISTNVNQTHKYIIFHVFNYLCKSAKRKEPIWEEQ